MLLNVDETEDGGGCSLARATRGARAERWCCFGRAAVRFGSESLSEDAGAPPLSPPTPASASQLQLRVQVTFTEVRGQAVTSPVQVLLHLSSGAADDMMSVTV